MFAWASHATAVGKCAVCVRCDFGGSFSGAERGFMMRSVGAGDRRCAWLVYEEPGVGLQAGVGKLTRVGSVAFTPTGRKLDGSKMYGQPRLGSQCVLCDTT